MNELPLIGRSGELDRLVHYLARGRHTLLLGEKGVGKSRLMREAVAVLSGTKPLITQAEELQRTTRRTLVISHCAPLGELLRELLEALHAAGILALEGSRARSWQEVRKALVGRTSVALQELAFSSLEGQKCLLVLDDLDRITPAHKNLIEGMLTRAVLCAGLTQVREGIHFRTIWSSFAHLKLEPLGEAAAEELARRLIEHYGIARGSREHLLRETLRAAAGNPHRIQNLLWHWSRERPLAPSTIRTLRREPGGGLFNMGPVYIFAASVFTLYKIFSIGLDNRESYIYFSAMGFVVYFGFRVFRNFFLFRPQRE